MTIARAYLSENNMDAATLLKQGQLAECKAQLFTQVKQDPSNVELRIFLFQLSCIERDWKRALSQLEVLKGLSDSTLALVNTYKQLIDCEAKRERVIAGDIEPTCFGEPLDWLAYYVQAYEQASAGKYQEAQTLLNNGIELASTSSGKVDGKAFSWLSDGDVRFGPSIEVMLNGGYYWLPFEYIKELHFEPVEDLRDLVWRPANLTLKNNGKLIVFVPVRYPIHGNTTDQQLLSRTCDWDEPVEHFFIGNGQRVLISEDNEYPLLDITSIVFE
ncbi:type VI secretion system accessory protein TagJ [Agaribacter marinus]|uniref:Virulence protein SciE type n=1 Tax=Agaribacter marinus TaxID=1431249 RepID=A0AA37T0T7_9ALTE|nr:type VI secretion system accessory protein TagJ [Agaribacter marinus]GLR71889.1 hypothetical protein GCM10007852_27970 [Agaribacter marinus]